MIRPSLISGTLLRVFLIGLLFNCGIAAFAQQPDRPNILWLTSEDNSPFLGCYGDQFATTPNLDKLARRGFRYTHAFANSPVCAPNRNTLITGVYVTANGHQHMRSEYNKSDAVRLYPELLREAGYYCTNNSKEDFNINQAQTRGIWDELGNTAHYKNRKPGQPFFAVFNSMLTHESSLFPPKPRQKLRHDPDKVKLPPYHPDTPELRHDWAYYYDNIEDMDAWVGKHLADLEASGAADNTIVFYYSDHGGVLPRSKRWVYETGTRVPLLIYIPTKYKHLWPVGQPGSVIDRLVSFVDLPPTLLSILGRPIPAYMQGKAFLGPKKTADPQYVYASRDRQEERYDMYRAVRDKQYRYIRNYMPHRVYGPQQEYLWLSQATRSWEAACQTGTCNETQQAFWKSKPVEELYDSENDPWEVNNLAQNPKYKTVLERMRKAHTDWMLTIRDTGFMPEADMVARTRTIPAYDYMRRGNVKLPALIGAAQRATAATAKDVPTLLRFLQADDPAIRYWGATGLRIVGDAAKPALPALRKAVGDSVHNVAIAAAEVLYALGEPDAGRAALIRGMRAADEAARTHALNIVDLMGEGDPAVRDELVAMVKRIGVMDRNRFDLRLAKRLFKKWNVDPSNYNIAFTWTWP